MEIFKTTLDWMSISVIPLMLLVFIGIAGFKKIKVYELFVEGAKEGFNIGVKIIPYLVAMLVAIAMVRGCGLLDFITHYLGYVTNLIGMPAEVLPMAFMRPLSGSGSLGIMSELMSTHGADSLIGFMASTMFGSTETTFYVIAVYFGAVNIQKTRYALPAGLAADVAGLIAAVLICNAIF